MNYSIMKQKVTMNVNDDSGEIETYVNDEFIGTFDCANDARRACENFITNMDVEETPTSNVTDFCKEKIAELKTLLKNCESSRIDDIKSNIEDLQQILRML